MLVICSGNHGSGTGGTGGNAQTAAQTFGGINSTLSVGTDGIGFEDTTADALAADITALTLFGIQMNDLRTRRHFGGPSSQIGTVWNTDFIVAVAHDKGPLSVFMTIQHIMHKTAFVEISVLMLIQYTGRIGDGSVTIMVRHTAIPANLRHE